MRIFTTQTHSTHTLTIKIVLMWNKISIMEYATITVTLTITMGIHIDNNYKPKKPTRHDTKPTSTIDTIVREDSRLRKQREKIRVKMHI